MKKHKQLLLLVILSLSLGCSSQGEVKNLEELENIKDTDLDETSFISYTNIEFHFKASVPKDWIIRREIVNDTINEMAFIDWGIPKVYSEIEKVDIENSVSIRAFKSETIKSVEDLIKNEYLKIDPTTTALEYEKGIEYDARILYFDAPNGAKYKGKIYYKHYKNISYIITFMATPGTFDKNLARFEQLNSSIIIK